MYDSCGYANSLFAYFLRFYDCFSKHLLRFHPGENLGTFLLLTLVGSGGIKDSLEDSSMKF